ncbi:hypothetical protein DY000_02007737 [Brassica cretica]|uniref:Uncharacterized protein n=1 Tax=Brassica cretica TaxID=69181 RepID=A0ABQ7C6J4_BRACR|nr:hypothetical protein DY000_02007737 [Brassica cretica]
MAKGIVPYPDRLEQAVKAKGALAKDAKRAGANAQAGENEGRALASHHQGAGKNMEHELIRKSGIDTLIKALKESGVHEAEEQPHIDHEGGNRNDADNQYLDHPDHPDQSGTHVVDEGGNEEHHEDQLELNFYSGSSITQVSGETDEQE